MLRFAHGDWKTTLGESSEASRDGKGQKDYGADGLGAFFFAALTAAFFSAAAITAGS
jgi:hypothetical protein